MPITSPAAKTVELDLGGFVTGVMVTTMHGETRKPDSMRAVLRCVVGQIGYVPGDEIEIEGGSIGTKAQSWCDSSQVGVFIVGPSYYARYKASSATGIISGTYWKLIVKCVWGA